MNELLFSLGGTVTMTLSLWVAGHALLRRERPGALPLALLGASLLVSTGALTASSVLGLGHPSYFGYGLVFATLLWTAFALEYTGRGPAMTRSRLAGLLGFGAFVVGLQALVIDVLALESPYLLLASTSNLLVLSLGGFGIFLVVRAGITYDDLPATRALVLAGAGVTLLLIWILGAVLDNQLELDTLLEGIVQALLLGSAALFALAQQRYDLLDTEPSAGHLARDSVFDEMMEAVLVADRQSQLLDTNRTAERAFDIERSMLGEPLEVVVGVSLDSHVGNVIALETRTGRREYEVRRSPVKGGGDRSVGAVYILRDVTDQQTHEQQLAVLNRVLRHNLRNDFDSIRGFAEPIRDGGVDAEEAATLGERIRRTADGVGELGAKVSRTERLLEWETLERESVDLAELSRAVADELREEYPRASIEVTVPDPLGSARTNREILHAIVEELVHNGLEHSEREEPSVHIALDGTPDQMTVVVADDGPGIPEHERAVLLDGEETPLRHGSGIGLWFVYWGIRRLGGTITFDEADPRGSVVTLTIPTSEPADESGTGI